jgi:uncharacterized membrane protein YfcA
VVEGIDMNIQDMASYFILIPLFMVTAAAYSSVGFGGGSTYLALLVAAGVPFAVLPSTALTCNIVVTLVGSYTFARAGYFRAKTVVPFLTTSIPAAYLGGLMPIGKQLFLLLLGLSLLAAALRLFLSDERFKRVREISWKHAWLVGLPIGAGLGFLSGLTGLGGGIFLAPVLYFLGWAEARVVAASASLFILVNSISGLAGQLTKESFSFAPEIALPLAAAALLGSFIGTEFGSNVLSPMVLRRVTAMLILFVSLNVLWKFF